MARQMDSFFRWVDADRLAESWGAEHFDPRFDRLDEMFREAGDHLSTLDKLVTIKRDPPGPPASAIHWVLYRDGGRIVVDRAERHQQELAQTVPLPAQAVVLIVPVVRELEVVYWGEEIFGGQGAILEEQGDHKRSLLALQTREGACDPAWLAGELQGEFIRLQLRRKAIGGFLYPALNGGDLFSLLVKVPPRRQQERAAVALKRRTATLFGVEPAEAERTFLVTGATFEERLQQFEEYVLAQSGVDRKAAFFVEAVEGPEGNKSSFIHLLTTRTRTPSLRPENGAGSLRQQGILLIQDDPVAAGEWWRWYWDPGAPFAVFNHLDEVKDLPASVLQAVLREQGPPPVPVGWVPPFRAWRTIVNAFRDEAGIGPAAWPEMCREWIRLATERGPRPAPAAEGKPASDERAEAIATSLGPWLRTFYRPGLAIKVVREGRVAGALLLFGPDQTDDPLGVRLRLEKQGAHLADILERSLVGGDDAFRRELIRRMSDIMHNLNGPIGRIVSALEDVERYLNQHPGIARTPVLDAAGVQGRAAMAARMAALRRGSAGGSPPAAAPEKCNPGSDPSQEQSSLLARIQVASRNVRLLQQASEQINDLRRVQNRLELEPLNLTELIRAAIQNCQDDIPHLYVVPSLPEAVWIQGNPEALRQAVEQVLANALRELKYRQSENPLLKISVSPVINEAILTLTDNGLPPAVRLIANPFKEGATTYNHLNLGNGIGLAFVRDVIHAHGGDCSLQENRDEQGERTEGVTFEARIPLLAAEERKV